MQLIQKMSEDTLIFSRALAHSECSKISQNPFCFLMTSSGRLGWHARVIWNGWKSADDMSNFAVSPCLLTAYRRCIIRDPKVALWPKSNPAHIWNRHSKRLSEKNAWIYSPTGSLLCSTSSLTSKGVAREHWVKGCFPVIIYNRIIYITHTYQSIMALYRFLLWE